MPELHFISISDPVLQRDYGDLFEALLKRDLSFRVVQDDKGVYRFEQNRLICWLADFAKVNFNDMARADQLGYFAPGERMEFYIGLGYSLCGFIVMFGGELGLFVDG